MIEERSGFFVGEMQPDGDSRLGQREHEQRAARDNNVNRSLEKIFVWRHI